MTRKYEDVGSVWDCTKLEMVGMSWGTLWYAVPSCPCVSWPLLDRKYWTRQTLGLTQCSCSYTFMLSSLLKAWKGKNNHGFPSVQGMHVAPWQRFCHCLFSYWWRVCTSQCQCTDQALDGVQGTQRDIICSFPSLVTHISQRKSVPTWWSRKVWVFL